MNVTHQRTSHQDHVLRRSMKKKEAMSWSLRSEIEKKRKIMWQACIEFNIWINIRINTFILSHRMLKSKFVLTHSENQIFYICLRRLSCIYLLISIFSCNYVVVSYLCITSHTMLIFEVKRWKDEKNSNLFATQTQQIMYKNEHTKFMSYKIENYVNLNDKNIKIKRNKKLKWKFFESFKIFECIENQIYRLNLLKRWRIHNVFHVFFLKKFNVNREKSAQTSQFFEFFYRVKNIELNENMKMKITKKFYEIEIIKNNKIFKIRSWRFKKIYVRWSRSRHVIMCFLNLLQLLNYDNTMI